MFFFTGHMRYGDKESMQVSSIIVLEFPVIYEIFEAQPDDLHFSQKTWDLEVAISRPPPPHETRLVASYSDPLKVVSVERLLLLCRVLRRGSPRPERMLSTFGHCLICVFSLHPIHRLRSLFTLYPDRSVHHHRRNPASILPAIVGVPPHFFHGKRSGRVDARNGRPATREGRGRE